MIRILPVPIANYRIDGKDLFTENQMHSYAIQCQEAVEEQKNKNRIDPCSIYLSKPSAQKTPPQREWQGLTDEEIKATWSQLWHDLNNGKFAASDDPSRHTTVMFAKAIEAKLSERNT